MQKVFLNFNICLNFFRYKFQIFFSHKNIFTPFDMTQASKMTKTSHSNAHETSSDVLEMNFSFSPPANNVEAGKILSADIRSVRNLIRFFLSFTVITSELCIIMKYLMEFSLLSVQQKKVFYHQRVDLLVIVFTCSNVSRLCVFISVHFYCHLL